MIEVRPTKNGSLFDQDVTTGQQDEKILVPCPYDMG